MDYWNWGVHKTHPITTANFNHTDQRHKYRKLTQNNLHHSDDDFCSACRNVG